MTCYPIAFLDSGEPIFLIICRKVFYHVHYRHTFTLQLIYLYYSKERLLVNHAKEPG